MDLSQCKGNPLSVISVVAGCILARVASFYLGYEPQLLWFGVLFILFYLSCRKLGLNQGTLRSLPVGGWRFALLAIFSALFSVSVVASSHIHVANPSGGTVTDNYIDPFTIFDGLGLVAVGVYVLVLVLGLCSLLSSGCLGFIRAHSFEPRPIKIREFALLFVILVVCWLPYLLVYWPGFVFGDSAYSIGQALHAYPLTNHHPVIFALALRACIKAASLFGLGNTFGVGLFTFIQLVCMAACFAYACAWVPSRLNVTDRLGIVFALFMGLSPYVASYSVALWKDPLFSCALLLIILFLIDYYLGSVNKSMAFCCMYLALLELMTMFMRNNGLYIIVVIAVMFFIEFIRGDAVKKELSRLLLLVSLGCIACCVVVSGPVFKAFGVQPSEKVESIGIPLGQMARVAALDGDMTNSDRDFMASMLPLERYKDAYHPCLIDTLKWDDEFNASDIHLDFFGHWWSMFVRNPKAYLDAWILQTFGYWSVNQPVVLSATWNIEAGDIHNWDGLMNEYDIYPSNLLGNDDLLGIVSYRDTSVPCGLILWLLLLFTVLFIVLGKGHYAFAFLPTLALIGTYFVAAPIWYWPRYIFAAQLALPAYLVYACIVMLKRPAPASDASSFE